MNEFLDTAYDLWRAGAVQKPADECFKTVFEAIASLQAVHSKSQLDLNNIESVFTTFEMAKTIGRFPGKAEKEIEDLIRALKVLIVQTLEKTVRFPYESREIKSPLPYDEFAGLLRHLKENTRPLQRVSIITFNYDIAPDYALYRKGFVADYGLDDKAPVEESIPLLKLHGSMNWSETISSVHEKAVIPWTMGEYWAGKGQLSSHFKGKYCHVPIGSELIEMSTMHKKLVTGEAVLVPPTWNKAETHRTLSKVWNRAATKLSEAENIFVIGYSMPETDAFFRYLYALGTVGDVLLKRFWVFDPDDSGRVKQRFEALLGPQAKARFNYNQMAFLEAIAMLKDKFPERDAGAFG